MKVASAAETNASPNGPESPVVPETIVSQEIYEIQKPIEESIEVPKAEREEIASSKEASQEVPDGSALEQTEQVQCKAEGNIPRVVIESEQTPPSEIEKESESTSSEPKKSISIDEDSTATVDVHEHDELLTEQQHSASCISSFLLNSTIFLDFS